MSYKYYLKEKKYLDVIKSIRILKNQRIDNSSPILLDYLINLKNKSRELKKYITKNKKDRYIPEIIEEEKVEKGYVNYIKSIFFQSTEKISFNELNNNLNEYNLISIIIDYSKPEKKNKHNYYQEKYSEIYKEKEGYITDNIKRRSKRGNRLIIRFLKIKYFWFHMKEFWDNEKLSFDFIYRYKNHIDYDNLRFDKYELSIYQKRKIGLYYFNY